jgi:hypothetical protein
VDEQHWNLDLRSSRHGTYVVDSKVTLLFRNLEGVRDDGGRKEHVTV